MQIEEHNKLVMLFDEYGSLLSAKQREIFGEFIGLDIAESELAELQGESRQSIHDAVSKAKKQLAEFEKKCGFVQKKQQLVAELKNLQNALADASTHEVSQKISEIIEKI